MQPKVGFSYHRRIITVASATIIPSLHDHTCSLPLSFLLWMPVISSPHQSDLKKKKIRIRSLLCLESSIKPSSYNRMQSSCLSGSHLTPAASLLTFLHCTSPFLILQTPQVCSPAAAFPSFFWNAFSLGLQTACSFTSSGLCLRERALP